MNLSQHTEGRYAPYHEIVHEFFSTFSPKEAHHLLHKMIRAAFARKDMLTKRDVLDLLFLKDELVKLVPAAEALVNDNTCKTKLAKFFRQWPATEWNNTLNMLFYAAVYDGFFTCPPNHLDIYHYCCGLHALVEACSSINETHHPLPENAW